MSRKEHELCTVVPPSRKRAPVPGPDVPCAFSSAIERASRGTTLNQKSSSHRRITRRLTFVCSAADDENDDVLRSKKIEYASATLSQWTRTLHSPLQCSSRSRPNEWITRVS
jgi:hypothetical protein